MSGGKRKQRTRTVLLGLCGVLLILVVVGYAWYQHRFPYGGSHACIKQIGWALAIYADENDGWFPSGGDSPEASLSLLYGDLNIYPLAGKTIAPEMAQRAIDEHGHLGPESCDWHYVEGLRDDDNPEIAIVWDKIGLGHNGDRLKSGGHEVLFVDRTSHLISGIEWEAFLLRQKELLAQRAFATNQPPSE